MSRLIESWRLRDVILLGRYSTAVTSTRFSNEEQMRVRRGERAETIRLLPRDVLGARDTQLLLVRIPYFGSHNGQTVTSENR